MYITIKRENASRYNKLKLCYIERIPESFTGYDDVDKEWVEISNFEYEKGEQEYYAYFTPAELDKQWGDDWNDRPYEYNAEIPYDDYYEGDMKVELNIIKVPFWVPSDGGYEIRFPRDWSHDNSPFSVQDINAGAVAWVFDSKTRTAIYAGCGPDEFLDKIGRITEARKEGKDA